MTKGELIPKSNPQTKIDVTFDLRFDTSTQQRPIAGIPIGKSDFTLTVESVSGAPIPAYEYTLHPEDSKYVFTVSNAEGHWTLQAVIAPQPGLPVSELEDLKQFAREVYRVVKGKECPVSCDPLKFGAGVPTDFIERAILHWEEEGVMKRTGLGELGVCLTPTGVAEIESWDH